MQSQNPNPIRLELKVVQKKYLTPHYIRVYLSGENISLFKNTTVGINNKILIPPTGVDQIHFPEKDPITGKPVQIEDSVRPIIRTYTHRGLDLETGQIWIDFVDHGDEGPASKWASTCKTGDLIGVMMKNEKKELYTRADHYLLVGDATAIPVLSAILEDLPKEASGICILEVHGKEDEIPISTKADISFHWIHNPNPKMGSPIADFVKTLDLPQGSKFGYIAAEFSTVKEIRNYLRKEKAWSREELYAYSYWKSGFAEDQSAIERRKEKETV